MMELDVMAIIQIDATIITGVLILLTITNLIRTTKEFWLPKAITSIVIPFAISALRRGPGHLPLLFERSRYVLLKLEVGR